MSLIRLKLAMVALSLVVTGCASSSDLEKRAEHHAKASAYYDSIGQPNAAREEGATAWENRDDANEVWPILVELFNHIYDKE